jgi:hydroxysqualene dehydroxylase
VNPNHHDIAIVGAGWAGLSAAITCVSAGKKVVLFDAAPQAGGRARHQKIQFTDELQVDLDNGQHLLIGAYTRCEALMAKVGAEPLLRNRLSLRTETGIFLESKAPTNRLAAIVFNVLGAIGKRGLRFAMARGLSNAEKWAIAKALTKLMVGLPANRWDGYCETRETVTSLLNRLSQPNSVQTNFWNPLCIATMNTAPEQADAATFCRVLRDTFGNKIFEASDFLLPNSNLGASFPEPALAWLEKNGCTVKLKSNIASLRKALSPQAGNTRFEFNDGLSANKIILAMPPSNAFRLLENYIGHGDKAVSENSTATAKQQLSALLSFDYLPIATIYLAWNITANSVLSAQVANIPVIYMLDEQRDKKRPGQWLFNRGIVTRGDQKFALASVVVSAWDLSVGLEELCSQVANQIASIDKLPLPLAKPELTKAIVEKKATIACTPTRPKVNPDYLQSNQFADTFKNIWLAGDYCYPLYPATLEGAVRSGEISANLACAANL